MVALYDPGDPGGRVTGHAPRSEVRAGNLPHAGTGVLVRDSAGRVYVHRRADTKDVFPGLHDCFAGGVVGAGEVPERAAYRELSEELGITGAALRPLLRSWYADDDTHYLGFVYAARWDGPIVHRDGEVAAGWWLSWAELVTKLADPGWPFVPDSRAVLTSCIADGLLP